MWFRRIIMQKPQHGHIVRCKSTKSPKVTDTPKISERSESTGALRKYRSAPMWPERSSAPFLTGARSNYCAALRSSNQALRSAPGSERGAERSEPLRSTSLCAHMFGKFCSVNSIFMNVRAHVRAHVRKCKQAIRLLPAWWNLLFVKSLKSPHIMLNNVLKLWFNIYIYIYNYILYYTFFLMTSSKKILLILLVVNIFDDPESQIDLI